MSLLAKLVASLCLVVLGLFTSGHLTLTAQAASPPIKFALYDTSTDCVETGLPGAVTAIHGVYDIDSFVRDALAGEVYSTWSVEGLKADAVAARGFTYYWFKNPEVDEYGMCSNISTRFHLSTKQIQGWRPDEMADEADDNNRPGDRASDTLLQVLIPSNNVPVYFTWVDTQQTALQNATGTYVARLAQVYPGLVVHNIYDFDATVTLDTRFPSMTNGTHVGAFPGDPVPGDSYSSSVTPVNTAREAEVYWGLKHMDPAQTSPLGQPGRYMIGAHMGDMIEFPLYIGGSYNQLRLIGIADRPAPVTVNVFVDGYWRARASWTAGSNLRAILTIPVPGVTYGAHAVAIQFTNDSYTAGGGYDGDRNLYLDVVGVSQ